MLNLNFIAFIILINFLKCSITNAIVEKDNNITINIGERGPKDVLKDYIYRRIHDNKFNQKLLMTTCSKEVVQNNTNSKKKDLPLFDVRIDTMPAKCYKADLPNDCASATQCTKRTGIYKIQVGPLFNEPFLVACDAETETGDWLVIQKRQDGSVDFYRNWLEYENGFGDIEGEFFIGLKKLHALTNYNGPQELLVVMEDDIGTAAYAKYDSFAIGDETEMYKLKRIGKYSGSAGNSLKMHMGMKFTTKDRDNDIRPESNCANDYVGAWWYRNCHLSNLNGKYGDNPVGNGIIWYTFRSHTVSLPYVKMMIRRSRVV